jgi:hypothetical protein
MKNNIAKSLFSALMLIGMSLPTYAEIITLDIKWSGESFGNDATASGFLTFEDTLCVPEVEDCGNLVGIIDFGITVSDAGTGSGTFGFFDFVEATFFSISPLDYNQELIGQMLSNGCLFGTSRGICGDGQGGDFNVFGDGISNSPIGTWFFELSTATGPMLVTSILNRNAMVAVSAPTGIMLMGLGLIAIGFSRKDKSA